MKTIQAIQVCLPICLTDLYSGVIPSGQHIKIATSVTAVKAEKILTYTANTDTKITVTINGVAYEQAYSTDAATTVANWLTTHKATVEARAGINGVVVTNPTGAQLKVVSKYAGQSFDFTAVANWFRFFCFFWCGCCCKAIYTFRG